MAGAVSPCIFPWAACWVPLGLPSEAEVATNRETRWESPTPNVSPSTGNGKMKGRVYWRLDDMIFQEAAVSALPTCKTCFRATASLGSGLGMVRPVPERALCNCLCLLTAEMHECQAGAKLDSAFHVSKR